MCLKHGNTMKMRMAVMAPSSQPSQPQSPPLLLLLLTMTPDTGALFDRPVVGIPATFGQNMHDTFIEYDISLVARHLAIRPIKSFIQKHWLQPVPLTCTQHTAS